MSKADNRRGVFAVVEGLTGVGKSTAARGVADLLGMRFISPFPAEFIEARNLLDSDPRMLDARYAFYFSSILHAGAQISDLLDSGEHVIVDSWIYRTHATHLALGSRLSLKPPAWLPEPDVKIMLICEEDERLRRMKLRGQASPHWKTLCEDVSDEVVAWYRKNIKKLLEVTVSYKLSSSATLAHEQTADQVSVDRMIGDVASKIRPVIKSRNETLVKTTAHDERFFLDSDLNDLDQKIQFTKELIREAKLLGQESTEQSSESWHDNYNFEESQRNLKMYLTNLGGLSNARERAVLITPTESSDRVTIGHRVTFKAEGTDSLTHIDLGSFMVGDDLRKKGFVSYDAPVARGLLGLKVGDTTTLMLSGERTLVEVVNFTTSPSLPTQQQGTDPLAQ